MDLLCHSAGDWIEATIPQGSQAPSVTYTKHATKTHRDATMHTMIFFLSGASRGKVTPAALLRRYNDTTGAKF